MKLSISALPAWYGRHCASEEARRGLLSGVSVLFCIAAILILLTQIWQTFFSVQPQQPDNAVVQVQSVEASPDRESVAAVSTWFKERVATPEKRSEERLRVAYPLDDDSVLYAVPKLRADVKLAGIVTSSFQEKNIVVVEENNRQISYGVDDAIAGRYPILKIYPDRVIVNEDGYYAALIMD